MSKPHTDDNQAEADKRRDELAKRVLRMPPHPKEKKEGGSRSRDRRPPASNEDDKED